MPHPSSPPVAHPAAGPRTPGLPDDAYEHDGQITKREVRAVTLALLAPRPGELLWDVGGGSGSIAVEWLRSDPTCRAVTVEPRPDRADRAARNAERMGVPSLEVVRGRAPEALDGLPAPDAVFVGGGLTVDGVLDRCRSALSRGGRLVANAVTLETETLLVQAARRHGGDLIRVAVERTAPVGRFTAWTPARAVTIWSATIEP